MTIRQFMYPTGIRRYHGKLIKLVRGRDYTIEHTPILSQIVYKRPITLKNGEVVEYAWASEEVGDDSNGR